MFVDKSLLLAVLEPLWQVCRCLQMMAIARIYKTLRQQVLSKINPPRAHIPIRVFWWLWIIPFCAISSIAFDDLTANLWKEGLHINRTGHHQWKFLAVKPLWSNQNPYKISIHLLEDATRYTSLHWRHVHAATCFGWKNEIKKRANDQTQRHTESETET
jgi:hypothetical protein